MKIINKDTSDEQPDKKECLGGSLTKEITTWGCKYFSYYTLIGVFCDGVLYCTRHTYTSTTGKHISRMRCKHDRCVLVSHYGLRGLIHDFNDGIFRTKTFNEKAYIG
jgi:hypothetical protein